MWITSQNDDVKKAIGGYFQDPWGSFSENTTPTMKTPAGLKGDAPFADSTTGILPNRWPQANQDNATDKQPGAASVWQQRQKVHLLTNADRNLAALVVTFNEGSAELPKDAQQRLKDLLPALVGKQNRMELRAHSTNRPLPKNGPYHDQWHLCFERGQQTMKFLTRNGVEPERIRLSESAAFEPLTTRLETAWQNENNCVEVFLLTEVVDKVSGTTQGAAAEQASANP
jgi:outer membrane protein OmpA-like peptidoglycan-associated protein